MTAVDLVDDPQSMLEKAEGSWGEIKTTLADAGMHHAPEQR